MKSIFKKSGGLILACLFLTGAAQAGEVAIVVNKSIASDECSLQELKRIMKAELLFWGDKKVQILMLDQSAWERKVILRKIYEMSEDDLRKLWLSKIFKGDITNFPAVFASSATVKQLVNRVPGAVSFIDSQAVDDTVKVLKINGKKPGEAGYLLQE